MDKSISSDASDSKEWHGSSASESDFSYVEDDDSDEENESEDETLESRRVIAIGVLTDDESKAPETTNTTIQDQKDHQLQQQAASDEAVANCIARKEHSTKMRIKEERGAFAQRRSNVNQSSITSRSEEERREKMRTFAGRKRVPRSRPLRTNPSEADDTAADSSKRSLGSTNDETIGSGGSSSQRSFSSGIDLDEKTRQRILTRSALRYARPKRSSLGTTNESNPTAQVASASPRNSRPSDEKRNMRTTPRMTGSSSNSAHQRRSSTQTSRPSDEKAAFRRRNDHPRRARALRTGTISGISPSEEGIASNDSDILEVEVATDDSIDPDMENTPGGDVDVEAAEFSDDDEEPEVLPGAFAVSGIGDDDDEPGVSGYDSGFENDSLLDTEDAAELGEESRHGDDTATTGASTRMETSTAISTPLTAELYEVEAAVTAKVLNADGEDPESKQKIRKLKIQLSCAFLVILLIAVTVMALVFTRSARKSPQDSPDQENLPIITGWEPVGEMLSLESPYKDDIRFGEAVAISADGNRIAVGLPGLDDSEDGKLKRAGSVHIFDLVNGTNWEENSKILGAHADAGLGTNVAISDDGKRVAIGAPSENNSDESGYVAIYEESSVTGQWAMAANFSVGIQERRFGESVAFAGDGSVIAIGDRYFDDRGLEAIGAVQIYQEVDGSWNEMGTTILGSKRGDLFGWSVSLSKDGNRVAASSRPSRVASSSLTLSEPGRVQIFDFNGTDWEMVGSSLIGESEQERFGSTVELSRDGSVLAVGATEYSRGQEEFVGIVRSYRYNNGDWMEYGQPLEGENRQDIFGRSISLSSDGSTIAIGGPENDNFCDMCGQVKVFQMTTSNDEFVWENVGSALGKPDIDNGQFGFAVALSERGRRVVSGAPFTKFDGLYSKVGEVLVFDSIVGEDSSD